MVAEEGEDCPGEGQDANNEEDQNGVWRKSVVVDKFVDEPGEHTHSTQLRNVSESCLFLLFNV